MRLSLRPAHLNRYRELAVLLARHGRSDLVRASGLEAVLTEGDAPLEETPEQVEAAESLAADLERMGPTFVKLGQLLSSRVDLLPPAYITALARLQDAVEPFPFAEVEELVTGELGVRLSRAFEDFDPVPLASASLGQVHRATLRGGRQVVVKVQRPGVRLQVAEDLEVLGELADFFDAHSDFGRRMALADLLEQFRKSLVAELDYRREAANLLTLGEVLAGRPALIVPRPHDDYCTGKVLTMDYIEGRKVTDLGPLGRLELDGAPLADELFRAYLEQVLVAGVFHADPHPGNVLVTPDGRLALIDVGMVARLQVGTRERLVKLFLALGEGRVDEVARQAQALGREMPDFDEETFRRSVAEVVEQTADATLAELDVGATVLELTRRSGEAGLRLAPELALLGKALLNLDQVAATLDPEFSPREALRRHSAEILKGGMQSTPGSAFTALLEAKEFAEHLPGRINRAMDAVADGRFEVRVRAFDETEFLRGLHKLANVIAAGLILAALIMGTAILGRPAVGSGVGSTVAVGVFFLTVLASLGLLVKIGLASRGVRPDRRR